MDILKKERYNFEDLREIVKILRSEDGCPWDREQTHESIRNEIIEEVYETVEAIDEGDAEMLREELGDVLLEVVHHSRISEEAGGFDADDVCDGICKKLIFRHPHVFGDKTADTVEQVLTNWEDIKFQEKGFADSREYIESAAKSLPALMRAEKIYKRAVKREAAEPVNPRGKLESLAEILRLLAESGNITAEDIGRVLFGIASAASELGVSSEQALYDYNGIFVEKMFKK